MNGDGAPAAPVRIAVWGLGTIYHTFISTLLAMRELEQIELVAAADTAPQSFANLDGMPVISPDELSGFDFDYLLIMNKSQIEEMVFDAGNRYGIPYGKIRTYKLLLIPYLDFRSYKRLCDSRISIVSNNSWGGLAYSALQMECFSPFKGTMFKEYEYLELLENLEDFLAIDSIPFIGARYNHEGGIYLSFELGDIELRITDEDDPQRALERWFASRTLINWDNVFVQMSTVDPKSELRFEKLERYPKRVCFVPYATKCSHSIQLPLSPLFGLFVPSVNDMVFERNEAIGFNLVDLLLHTSISRR